MERVNTDHCFKKCGYKEEQRFEAIGGSCHRLMEGLGSLVLILGYKVLQHVFCICNNNPLEMKKKGPPRDKMRRMGSCGKLSGFSFEKWRDISSWGKRKMGLLNRYILIKSKGKVRAFQSDGFYLVNRLVGDILMSVRIATARQKLSDGRYL